MIDSVQYEEIGGNSVETHEFKFSILIKLSVNTFLVKIESPCC